jgi:uncharacterized protein YsxB (DUF464 family)
MIKIVIKTDELTKTITSIEVKGHANSAEYGKDLVCAAVSAIITGGANALEEDIYDVKLEEGNAYIKAKQIPGNNDAVVLRTIQTQLLTIEEIEKKFIKIEIF